MINFYEIEVFTKNDNFIPPFFIGSMVRGAFGVALKKVVCMNPTYSCDNCFMKESCCYYKFYEEKNKTLKYRFDIALKPKTINFKLYLFEEATKELMYILNAITKVFNEIGLGVDRQKFEIEKIICNSEVIFNGREFKLNSNIQTFECSDYYPNLKLKLLTPLRIKENNRLIKYMPKLETILQSIQNRRDDLKGVVKSKLSFTPNYKIKNSKVRFLDSLTRYSNRQRTKMSLGGLIGEIEIDNIDSESFELLKLGEIIGVGKSCVFGLGKIEVEEMNG